MSIKERQDNEEFKVVSMDKEAIKGDANKLKLLITSYATIMEVQDAYMQEEIKAKEEDAKRAEAQIASGNLTEVGVESKKEELEEFTDQIKSLKEVYDKFSESRTRFTDFAKRALSLPNANFKQLAEEGYTIISGEKIELSNLASSYEEAEKTLTNKENKDVFSNINNEDIKKEIERVITEEVYTDDKTGEEKPVKEYIPDEVNIDKFDENALELANFVKENIDANNDEKLAEKGNDYFDKALAAAEDKNDKVKEEKIEETTIEIPQFSVGTEGKWVEPEKPNTDDSINFDGDNSILDYISKLEQDVQEINASREEIKGQTQKALKDRNAAEAARNEAKDKSEKAKNDVAMLEKYMPRINELQEAKRKGQQDLDAEMAKLASTNSEKTAFETEMQVYAEETRQSLEKLKEMKAILNGEEPEQKKEDLPSNVLK